MRKFDGKDPVTWILQMEQFFDLNNGKNTQKVRIATLYLEPNQFVWYQWLCSCKQIITWEKIDQRLKIQHLRGGNLLYITEMNDSLMIQTTKPPFFI